MSTDELADLVFAHTGETCFSKDCGEGFGYHDVESERDRRAGCAHIAAAILASDWLRAIKAEAWDEGYGSDEECLVPRANPYREST